jgi:hypothetical protein
MTGGRDPLAKEDWLYLQGKVLRGFLTAIALSEAPAMIDTAYTCQTTPAIEPQRAFQPAIRGPWVGTLAFKTDGNYGRVVK